MPATIPRLKRSELFDQVQKLNKPFSADPLQNPLAALNLFIHAENPGLAEWSSHVGGNLNQGMGGDDEHMTVERRVFDNSFLAAYDLISHGYRSNELTLPTIATPPDWYSWLGFKDEPNIGEMFTRYNERQHEVHDEYYDYIEALQTWAGESVMAFSSPHRVGVTAMAGAEVYLSFRDHQED